jgi:hypothetical protein
MYGRQTVGQAPLTPCREELRETDTTCGSNEGPSASDAKVTLSFGATLAADNVYGYDFYLDTQTIASTCPGNTVGSSCNGVEVGSTVSVGPLSGLEWYNSGAYSQYINFCLAGMGIC